VQTAALKGAIAEGMQVYDFLRGDEPYKALWRAERHSLAELRIVARHPAARLRHRAWLAAIRVKRLLREAAKVAKRRSSTSTDPDPTETHEMVAV
jgi:CelD/BcsL family acetyltransferase involved in cellulose biosynthesis